MTASKTLAPPPAAVRRRLCFVIAALLVLGLATQSQAVAQDTGPGPENVQLVTAALGTAISYQGQLRSSGVPMGGTCDFEFTLWDAASAGTQVGPTVARPGVSVAGGLFTISLDFGAGAFVGEARWLAIAVRCPAGIGDYTALAPRQALSPVPAALALPGLYTQQNITSTNVIGGHISNSVANGVWGAVISGGGQSGSPNQVSARFGTIGGGLSNTVSGEYATIGGGWNNSVYAEYYFDARYATVAGGEDNRASGGNAAIGGGRGNDASGALATIAGGWNNDASGGIATVGGGQDHIASGDRSIIAGGLRNRASGVYAAVGGGSENNASGFGAGVPGGGSNVAAGDYSFAAGHGARAMHANTFVWSDAALSFGYHNPFTSTAAAQFLIRAGGGVGIGTNAPGGQVQVSADSSTDWPHLVLQETGASGDYARLRFLWPGSSEYWTAAAGAGAAGLFNLYYSGVGDVLSLRPEDATNLLLMSNGARLTAGGAWTNASDRSLKAEFAPVDSQAILAQVVGLPIESWRYQAEGAGVRHLGPTAQDFRAAFGLGDSDTAISTVDADGVALAAIQGLHAQVKELEAEVAQLKQAQPSMTTAPRGVPGAALPWLLLGGLGLFNVGLLAGRRWPRKGGGQ